MSPPVSRSLFVAFTASRGVVKMMLELSGIDMTVAQTLTKNTPLLMLVKVVDRDGPDEVAVAGLPLALANSLQF